VYYSSENTLWMVIPTDLYSLFVWSSELLLYQTSSWRSSLRAGPAKPFCLYHHWMAES